MAIVRRGLDDIISIKEWFELSTPDNEERDNSFFIFSDFLIL